MKLLDKKIDFEKVRLHCDKRPIDCYSCLIGKVSKLNGCRSEASGDLATKFSLEEKYPIDVTSKIQGCLPLHFCNIIGLHHNKLFEEEKEYRDKMKAILE